MKKLAVSIILPTFNTVEEVVAISRRNDASKWGYPGGKVDPLESPEEAICRETKEETGLEVRPDYLVPIYAGMCYGADGNDFWTITYLCEKFWGVPLPEKGLIIRQMEGLELCSELYSPFAVYNRNVLAQWRNFKA